jgi:DNA-binding transcriptional LysR family regulator
MIHFVEVGVAVAIMPGRVASRYARVAPVVTVQLSDAWEDRQFAVCCRSRRALPKPAAALFNLLTARSEPTARI